MNTQEYRPLVVRSLRFGREIFYHTHGRGYIDLEDLRDMKADGEPFVIRDEETGNDVTRVVLA